MSFEAYIENIKAKTGKTPDDFIKLAEKKGFLAPSVKATEVTDWLKKDFELGHGHAMAIYHIIKSTQEPAATKDDAVDKHFSGTKAVWRKTYDGLMAKLTKLGNDINVAPTASYISILRGSKKLAVVAVTADRMDIGIKLKGVEPEGRFEAAGKWNSMMTHRVQIADPKQVDAELMKWLKDAYTQHA